MQSEFEAVSPNKEYVPKFDALVVADFDIKLMKLITALARAERNRIFVSSAAINSDDLEQLRNNLQEAYGNNLFNKKQFESSKLAILNQLEQINNRLLECDEFINALAGNRVRESKIMAKRKQDVILAYQQLREAYAFIASNQDNQDNIKDNKTEEIVDALSEDEMKPLFEAEARAALSQGEINLLFGAEQEETNSFIPIKQEEIKVNEVKEVENIVEVKTQQENVENGNEINDVAEEKQAEINDATEISLRIKFDGFDKNTSNIICMNYYLAMSKLCKSLDKLESKELKKSKEYKNFYNAIRQSVNAIKANLENGNIVDRDRMFENIFSESTCCAKEYIDSIRNNRLDKQQFKIVFAINKFGIIRFSFNNGIINPNEDDKRKAARSLVLEDLIQKMSSKNLEEAEEAKNSLLDIDIFCSLVDEQVYAKSYTEGN